jgi:hypothetical protein
MSITDSLSFDQTYYQTGSTLRINGNIQISAQPSKYSHTNLGLSYTHSPLLVAPTPIVIGNTIIGQSYQVDSEALNWNYNTSAANGIWNIFLGSTYGLPTKNLSMSSGLNYRLSSQMHFSLGSYYSQFLGYAYRDYTFSISHRLGLRDIQLSWSALLHNWQVNLADSQF